MYKCDLCGQQSESKETLKKQIETCHCDSARTAHHVKNTSRSQSFSQGYYTQGSVNEELSPSSCKLYPTLSNVPSHDVSGCENCGSTFPSSADLKQHMRYHHEFPTHELHCGQCESTFYKMVHLNVHIRDTHTDDLTGDEHCASDIPQMDGNESISITLIGFLVSDVGMYYHGYLT